MGVSAAVALFAGATAYQASEAEDAEDKQYARQQQAKKDAEKMLVDQRNADMAAQGRNSAAGNQAKKRMAAAQGRSSTNNGGMLGGAPGAGQAAPQTLLGY